MNLDSALETIIKALGTPDGRDRVAKGLCGHLGDQVWDVFYDRIRLEHLTRLPYRKMRKRAAIGSQKAKDLIQQYLKSFPHLKQAEPPENPVNSVFDKEIEAVPVQGL